MTRRLLAPAALGAVSVLALAGCAGGAPAAQQSGTAAPDAISVVASTNVYGQIVSEIGGEHVDVTSIVSNASQDPHSYEPSAQDQLTISTADLIVENGGGYDAFVDALIESSGSTAPVITAATFNHDYPGAESHADDTHADDESTASPDASEEAHSHDEGDDHSHEDGDGHTHIEGFNEHVWYDPHTMEHLAEAIAEELGELAPDHAADFTANADAFVAEIGGLEDSLGEIEATDAGQKVFVTEPVPVYLTTAAGLDNATPSAFSEAVEEGQDVPPATLLEAMQLIDSGDIRVVIVNPQTGGAETSQIVTEAEAKDIPVIEFAETLPEGQTYISWMQENIAALADALGK